MKTNLEDTVSYNKWAGWGTGGWGGKGGGERGRCPSSSSPDEHDGGRRS